MFLYLEAMVLNLDPCAAEFMQLHFCPKITEFSEAYVRQGTMLLFQKETILSVSVWKRVPDDVFRGMKWPGRCSP